MQKVDAEIRRIIDEQYGLARKLIEDNRDKIDAMAKPCSSGKPSTAISSTTSWRAVRRGLRLGRAGAQAGAAPAPGGGGALGSPAAR